VYVCAFVCVCVCVCMLDTNTKPCIVAIFVIADLQTIFYSWYVRAFVLVFWAIRKKIFHMPSKMVWDKAVKRKAKGNFHVMGDLIFWGQQVWYLNKNFIIFRVLHQASFQHHEMFVAVVTLIAHIQQSAFSYYRVRKIKKSVSWAWHLNQISKKLIISFAD